MGSYVKATFFEKGVPKDGLNPTVNIRELPAGDLAVEAGAMTGIGDGTYIHDFTDWDCTKDYSILVDSVTLTGDERYAEGEISGPRVIESSDTQDLTPDDMLRIILAFMVNTRSGGGTSNQEFDSLNGERGRVTLVVDENGNILSSVLDGTP